MRQSPADTYKNTTQVLLTLLVMVSIPIVLTATFTIAGLIEDEVWSVVTGIVVFLVTTGLAITQAEKLKTRRTDTEFAMRFAGYAGARFPLFYLLQYEDPRGALDLSNPDFIYSLGESDERLFLMRNRRPDDIAEMPPGALVPHPKVFRPVSLRLPEIVDVTVIERTDEEIAGSAVDKRDWGERVGSQIAQGLTGTRVKTTIIPYAAFVAVTAVGEDGETFLLAAIPTTVTAATLEKLGVLVEDTDFELPWLASKGIEGARALAFSELDQRAGRILDEETMETIHEGIETGGAALEAVGEAASWINPDAAAIGTTAGANGRRVAQLIGHRIRQRAGLATAAYVS